MESWTLLETKKLLVAELRRHGVKPLRARSQHYAGGCSIRVVIPESDWRRLGDSFLSGLCSKYAYGYFEGMTDTYYNASRPIDGKLPGAKYVFIDRGTP